MCSVVCCIHHSQTTNSLHASANIDSLFLCHDFRLVLLLPIHFNTGATTVRLWQDGITRFLCVVSLLNLVQSLLCCCYAHCKRMLHCVLYLHCTYCAVYTLTFPVAVIHHNLCGLLGHVCRPTVSW